MRGPRRGALPLPVAIRAGGAFGGLVVDAAPGALIALVASHGTARAEGDPVVLSPLEREGAWRELARSGVSRVPSELALFPSLTVQEHLELGRVRRRRPDRLSEVLEWLPELRPLRSRRAGLLSGGERQLLAVARALSGTPRVLLVEEVTTGLSPAAARRVAAALRGAADEWHTAVVAFDRRDEPLCDVADEVLHPGDATDRGGRR